ncbi:hypothetical protein EUGRSUZ_A01237 [Eucalyptus grandis]|uniref:Uncharacterized protein n=2 Tax=Eucalyptus grandis TaxID=71139 RepID=A0ACC3M255_EUCGR|nr:hypothetical protein EUGRSUZ_A01237 [Eucalyptus grandis]
MCTSRSLLPFVIRLVDRWQTRARLVFFSIFGSPQKRESVTETPHRPQLRRDNVPTHSHRTTVRKSVPVPGRPHFPTPYKIENSVPWNF